MISDIVLVHLEARSKAACVHFICGIRGTLIEVFAGGRLQFRLRSNCKPGRRPGIKFPLLKPTFQIDQIPSEDFLRISSAMF